MWNTPGQNLTTILRLSKLQFRKTVNKSWDKFLNLKKTSLEIFFSLYRLSYMITDIPVFNLTPDDQGPVL